MVNNFELIKTLLQFDSEDEFYFLQILKRRKDNPDMEKDMVVINQYYLYKGSIDKLKEQIIIDCHSNNARAYINLNRRNSGKVALHCLSKMAKMIELGQWKDIKRAYASSVGECSSEKDKKWVVDIDTKKWSVVSEVKELIDRARGEVTEVYVVPTLLGYHLITPGFDAREFRERFSDVVIQKDNPTVLYIP
jgi:hypothetical protein